MFHNPLFATEIDILVLLAVACLTAIALTRFKFPYTVALVILGIGLGWLGGHVESLAFLQTLTLSHDLILFVFVPPLIFESALNLDSRLLLRNLVPILTLAAPGLLISTAIVGAILSCGTPLDLPQALLFGSLISATDPVAVIALFKELGAPKRLGILVEGESLFNDATAIVTFNIILAAISTGQGFGLPTLQQGGMDFIVSFVGGIAVGAFVGFAMHLPMSLTKKNPLVLVTLSTIVAYGTFLIAEEFVHVSGVIGIVSAGIVLGWFKSNQLKPEARHFMGEFWEYLAFLANSLIFLLVGLTVSGLNFFSQVEQTEDLFGAIALTLVTILVARAIVVFGLTALVNHFRPGSPVDWRYQLVGWWGGLRGAVCLALALSFDPSFPNRDLMLMLTLGVVLFTLLIPGTTIAALMRQLGLDLPPLFDQLNQGLARSLAQKSALEQLPLLESTFVEPQPQMLAQYQQTEQANLDQARQSLGLLIEREAIEPAMLQQWVWSIALSLEQQVYQDIYDAGFVSEPFLSQFKLIVGLKQDAVAAGQMPPAQTDQPIFEARMRLLFLKLWEQFSSERAETLRSQIQFSTAQYWGIVTHAMGVVPLRLESLCQDSGLDPSLFQACLDQYQQWQAEAQNHLASAGATAPGLLLDLQIQTAGRISQLSQNQAIASLIKAGVLSPDLGRSLIRPVQSVSTSPTSKP